MAGIRHNYRKVHFQKTNNDFKFAFCSQGKNNLFISLLGQRSSYHKNGKTS